MTKTKSQKQRANAQKSAQPKKTMVKKVSQSQPRRGLQTKISKVAFHYFVSLLFPSTQTSRIPDICSISTSVYQVSYDFVVTAASNGHGGAYVRLGNWPQLFIEDVALTGETFVFGSGGVVAAPGMTTIQSTFSASRPVSGELYAYSTSADLSNQGRIAAYTLASNSIAFLEDKPATFAAILGTRDNWGTTVKEGIFARYKPVDSTSDTFSPTTGVGFSRNEFGFHFTGVQASSSFVCRLVVNYEGISKADTLSFQNSEPSVSDPTGFAAVKQALSKVSSFASYTQVDSLLSSANQMIVGENPARVMQIARGILAAGNYFY